MSTNTHSIDSIEVRRTHPKKPEYRAIAHWSNDRRSYGPECTNEWEAKSRLIERLVESNWEDGFTVAELRAL